MKKHLAKKLAAYSGMATTAILVAQQSNAQIIYTNPPDIHLNGVGAHHALDLNNDGLVDVNVRIDDFSPATPGFEVLIENINTPWSTSRVSGIMYKDCEGSFFYGYGLFPFKVGKTISENINSYYQTWYPVQSGELLNWDYYGGTCHRWSGLKKHFVGFSYRPSPNNFDDYNYGWIRLSVNHSGSKVIIHDWAFNSALNESIITGQTMKLTNEDLQVSSDLKIYSYSKQIFINQNSQNLPFEISIYNLLGEEVKHVTSADENLNIQADQFPSGIYIVKVRSNGENISKEVVIE